MTDLEATFARDGYVRVAGAVAPDVVDAWQMYDQLLGPGRWVPRQGVDAGWHIDGSYDVDGQWFVNLRSKRRGLLALFLFTDVGPDDVPTELIVGSHMDVPPLLVSFGDAGCAFDTGSLPATTFERPRAVATGNAGDVFLCHPFMVHRATWPHRGRRPRIIAQPEISHHEPFALNPDTVTSVVELTILDSLTSANESAR
jgi:hypothetical protein